MTGIYPGYYSMTIPAGTYRGQDEEVNTVGVKAVLTAEARVSSESVRAVTAALFENASSIKYTMTVPAPDIELRGDRYSAAGSIRGRRLLFVERA